ncbi:MAG TPA: hypothetical protein VK071_00010 [Tissierellales bacterium]|nr:hypothetical protein [Tissierellales bacterium]
MKNCLLEVDSLETNYYINDEILFPLYDISFKLYEKEITVMISNEDIFRRGLIYSIMGLIDENKNIGKIVVGNIYFCGNDILAMGKGGKRNIRGNKISAIHNSSVKGLNPRFKVGYQIKEPLIIHRKDVKNKDKKAKEILENMGIENVQKVYESYPYQLDDLTIFQVHLAIGLICDPEILIINDIIENLNEDEKMKVFDYLKKIKEESGTSILLMTDDLKVINEVADRVIVSDKGTLIEDCLIEKFNNEPLHPYTKDLINNSFDRKNWNFKRKLYSCIYYDKCNKGMESCLEYLPEYVFYNERHNVRCIFYMKKQP